MANKTYLCLYIYMGVSKNNGTPKSSILIGRSIINHPFWGTTIFGNSHIYLLWKHIYAGWLSFADGQFTGPGLQNAIQGYLAMQRNLLDSSFLSKLVILIQPEQSLGIGWKILEDYSGRIAIIPKPELRGFWWNSLTKPRRVGRDNLPRLFRVCMFVIKFHPKALMINWMAWNSSYIPAGLQPCLLDTSPKFNIAPQKLPSQ